MITATATENTTGSAAARAAGLVTADGKGRTVVTRQARAARWRFGFTTTTPDRGLFPRRAWARAAARPVAAALLGAFPAGNAAGGTP
jgi:hypothetical protein